MEENSWKQCHFDPWGLLSSLINTWLEASVQTLCVYSKKEIFFKARWGRRLQKGSSWKSPASLGVTNVSFVLILVPDLWTILYFLGLSAGVLGCCGTVTPVLVNLVSPVFLWLHLPSFLSLWTFLVKRFLACYWGDFCSKAVPPSIPNTLLSVGQFATADGCWKQNQQAPGFLGKISHFTM